MAGAYLVTRPAVTGGQAKAGHNAAIVYAEDAADAKALCKALTDGESDTVWDDATATALVAGADYEGYRLRVVISNFDDGEPLDVTVTGAASATIDSIAALAVTAINAAGVGALAGAGASYDNSTNVLTVAAAADNIGDKHVEAYFMPPVSYPGAKPIPGFVGTITDEGNANAALTVALAADARAKPAFYGLIKTL